MPSYTASTPKAGGKILVPPGIYLVEVREAKEDKAKETNNDKIEMTCLIHPFQALVWDNLVFTEKAFWKIDNFRASTGDTVTKGEEVEIDAEYCQGRKGWCRIGNEQNDRTGEWKNVILSWLIDFDPKTMPHGPDPTPQRKQEPRPNPMAPDPNDAGRPPSNVGVPTGSVEDANRALASASSKKGLSDVDIPF